MVKDAHGLEKIILREPRGASAQVPPLARPVLVRVVADCCAVRLQSSFELGHFMAAMLSSLIVSPLTSLSDPFVWRASHILEK